MRQVNMEPTLVPPVTHNPVYSVTIFQASLCKIHAAWQPIEPPTYTAPDPYKKEEAPTLQLRKEYGFSNFPNIGGNPTTRLKIKAPNSQENVFFEANWVADDKIATGYPSLGVMANSYWYYLDHLSSKQYSPIIVNLMADKDVNLYGRFLPTKEGHMVGKDGLSTVGSHDEWVKTVFLVKKFSFGKWSHLDINLGGCSISGYHFPTWEDHTGTEIEIVAAMIKSIYEEMNNKFNPVVVCNCRAGVGRTGTFLIALHYYQMIQGGKRDPGKYTLSAIIAVIEEFREKRGDMQFLQTKDQFIMLYTLIQTFYQQKFSKNC